MARIESRRGGKAIASMHLYLVETYFGGKMVIDLLVWKSLPKAYLKKSLPMAYLLKSLPKARNVDDAVKRMPAETPYLNR